MAAAAAASKRKGQVSSPSSRRRRHLPSRRLRRNLAGGQAFLAVMEDKIHDQASEVAAEDGAVVVDGPDGVAVLLTPDAASETSDRLLRGAMEARGQQIQRRLRDGDQA
jgi:hypothetical protein